MGGGRGLSKAYFGPQDECEGGHNIISNMNMALVSFQRGCLLSRG